MELNKLFTSHMVFAANKPIRVFGTGSGTVTIKFNGTVVTVNSENDKWIAELPSMEYGGPYEMDVDLSGNMVHLDDIYIGDVYLFAGQSNMQFKCHEATKPEKEYKPGKDIRFFVTDRLEEGDLYNSDNGWLVCDDEVSKNISALGYFTSCEIAAKKDIVVGGVCCYQGASVIESWLPVNALKNIGIDIPYENRTLSHTCEEYSAWNKDGCLYNFTFLKIVPFSFTAVVWYQGESDCKYAESEVYSQELALLIDIWRDDLKNNALPFVVIQLADYDSEYIDQKGWARMQQAQLEIMDLRDNVKTIICRDICEKNDIHPPTKDKLAIRIADVLTM